MTTPRTAGAGLARRALRASSARLPARQLPNGSSSTSKKDCGPVVVVVDGVNVFSDSVQPVSIVGLVKSIHVRPKRWPAEVDVRGMRATTHVSVPRATRFMAVHGPALTTGLSATPFMYE